MQQSNMQMIFNSELYTLIAYPDNNAIELIDKVCQRSALLHSEAAAKFTADARKLFSQVPPDPNAVDDLIETCTGLMIHENATQHH